MDACEFAIDIDGDGEGPVEAATSSFALFMVTSTNYITVRLVFSPVPVTHSKGGSSQTADTCYVMHNATNVT